jgi:hypothetical protein
VDAVLINTVVNTTGAYPRCPCRRPPKHGCPHQQVPRRSSGRSEPALPR